MPVRIHNRSRRLVTVELNSGRSLHLGPGEVSPAVDDVETRENPWLDKLVARGLASTEATQGRREGEPRGGGRGGRRADKR